MTPRGRSRLALLACAFLCALPGCFGVTSNPSYFPYLCPFGDIIPTHAKPTGLGYYANFDPSVVRLEVRPVSMSNPVRTDLALLATVYDDKGQPRRGRRIEWMIEGVGNLIEVDESGCWPGRGYKKDNKYGVSYTNYFEHQMTRGTKKPQDDFVIRPGQSWCVLTSAVEGDTHVTVWAPGIHEWEKSKVHLTFRWVDAAGVFPGPITASAGSEAVLITKVIRQTDQQSLANYKVRYRVLDGPAALFVANRSTEFEASSDLSGNAIARLVQQVAVPGVNRIGMEIIRPPDPTAPSGVGVVIAKGETTVEWLAPSVVMTHSAPPTASLNQDVPFTITLANNGKTEVRYSTVTNPIPKDLRFIRSNPPAAVENDRLVFTMGKLLPQQTQVIEAVFAGQRPGNYTSCATVVTAEGLTDQKCAATQLVQVIPGSLKINVQGPATTALGSAVPVRLSVRNDGGAPVANVKVSARFGEGLEHDAGPSLSAELGTLGAGETKDLPEVKLTARKLGRLAATFTVTGDGNALAQVDYGVLVQEPKLSLEMVGPKVRYFNQVAEFELRVSNLGDVPLTNVTVRDQLPPELGFLDSTDGGAPAGRGEVSWNLGTLPPGAKKSVRLRARCETLAKAAVNRATAAADAGGAARAEWSVDVQGLPGQKLEVKDIGDPVAIGKRVTYEIKVTNTGSAPILQLEIKGIAPKELRLVPEGSRGPTKATILPNEVTFAKLEKLEPQETATYFIDAEGMAPGDVRFQVEVRSQTYPEVTAQQEATRVFDPVGPPPPPPPPPVPMSNAGGPILHVF